MNNQENSAIVAALSSGFSWGSAPVSSCLPVVGRSWAYTGESSGPAYGVLSSAQADRFRAAVNAWDEVVAATLLEVREPEAVGRIRVAFSNVGTIDSGYAYYPVGEAQGGDIWLGEKLKTSDFANGSYGYNIMLHELGHALGLKHPHEASGLSSTILPVEQDDMRHTVMSYHEQPGRYKLDFYIDSSNNLAYSATFVYATTPMPLDILAVQAIYGVDISTRTGNDTYRWESGKAFLATIWDAGGVDTLDASNQTASIINLNPGTFSSIGQVSADTLKQTVAQQFSNYPVSWINEKVDRFVADGSLYTGKDNLAIAYGVTLENAVGGSGNDVLIGNAANNTLRGGAGNDLLEGGGGNNSLFGDAGYDIARYDVSADTYRLTKSGNVWGLSAIGSERVDTLYDMESIQFLDKIFFDSSEARQVYRLYKAAFDRTPDKDGLGYWVGEYVAGSGLEQISTGFTSSKEFMDLYPVGNTVTFLNGLYDNVLGRAPDAGGLAYWQGAMQQGMQASAVLLAFSESSENRVNLSAQIDDGFWLA